MMLTVLLLDSATAIDVGEYENRVNGCGDSHAVTVPETLGLLALAAVIVTLCKDAIKDGAEYNPLASILPADAGLIDHSTPALPMLDVMAANCWVWPG